MYSMYPLQRPPGRTIISWRKVFFWLLSELRFCATAAGRCAGRSSAAQRNTGFGPAQTFLRQACLGRRRELKKINRSIFSFLLSRNVRRKKNRFWPLNALCHVFFFGNTRSTIKHTTGTVSTRYNTPHCFLASGVPCAGRSSLRWRSGGLRWPSGGLTHPWRVWRAILYTRCIAFFCLQRPVRLGWPQAPSEGLLLIRPRRALRAARLPAA